MLALAASVAGATVTFLILEAFAWWKRRTRLADRLRPYTLK